jgi:cysteine-rich repeat protein
MRDGTIGRFVCATLLVTLGVTSPAAAVDLSGDYVVTVPIACRVTIVQTGTAIQTTGSCNFMGPSTPFSASGTVDPATGVFSESWELGGVCAGITSGTGDGEVITGTATAPCYSGPIADTKCGNGVIDPLENCEDGNQADGDCCSARCRLDPAGTACTSDGNDCTDDVCNATATCTHVPRAGPCDDGNACTIGDVCADGACVPGAPALAGQACNDDFDACTADVCDAAGTCTHVPLPPEKCRQAVASRDVARCMATQCEGVGREACRRRCKPAGIRTLAYVLSQCREDAAGMAVSHEALLIRRGDEEQIPVVEFGPSEPMPDPQGFCRFYGESRQGGGSVAGGVLQRLGVSPDGSGVVFEVNSEAPVAFRGPPLPPDQQGFFFVRADGSAPPRRLGPASRDPTFRIASGPTGPPTFTWLAPWVGFSPNGRRIAFTDLGPGPGGEEAVQMFVLDLKTDRPAHQVTQLPAASVISLYPDSCCPQFLDNETVFFRTVLDLDGSNPGHHLIGATVRIDGSNFKLVPPPVAVQGSRVVPTFGVTGHGATLVNLSVPGTAVNPPVGFAINEVFLLDGKNLVQLTNFRRVDTWGEFLNVPRTRAFFVASAPSMENPYGNCELFSVGTRGSGLRQVTHFNPGSPVELGCSAPAPPGCNVGQFAALQDPVTKAVVFDSSCDPFGANTFGGQVFAMRPDGTGLRQLTDAAGFTTSSDGSIRVELPGPFAYSTALH